MARGIHLRHLRSADLEAIGVPNDELAETAHGESLRELSLLAEADPVLARTIDEVRQGLITTLQLLDEALATDETSQASPPVPEKSGN